jgi:phosphatidylserine/phosphatidylglycerophosphate/cardiolipin synthase-like enzyme/predicted Rdx family selenoprotein
MEKYRFIFPIRAFALWGIAIATLLPLSATRAFAQETIYFPAHDDALSQIVAKINAENYRLDIGLWLLDDGTITTAIINKFKSGVPVRVLGDRAGIFESDPNTRASFEKLAAAGVPIRLRVNPTWFPEIMHWKYGGFTGQGGAFIGSGNWTTYELVPFSSTNYKDETEMYTNDPTIVNALRYKFDLMWADTTTEPLAQVSAPYMLDWPDAYKNDTGKDWATDCPVRVPGGLCPPMNIPHGRADSGTAPTNAISWGQGLNDIIPAMINEINGEPAGGAIDVVSYRLTVPSVTDALIARKKAGVAVRVFIEPTQYRSDKFPEYWLVGNEADRLWAANIPIKIRTHDGLTHMKTLITSRSALLASSNYTKNWQRDHNYFIPLATKPTLYAQMKNEFNRMWNDTVHYTDFTPLKPQPVTLVAPTADQPNVSTTPTLTWTRAPWAVAFDVYLGTSPSSMAPIGRVGAVLNEDPPQTYSYTVTQSLQPNTTYYWNVVSRTFATDINPSLVANPSTLAFTTGSSSAGGGTSGPYSGTPMSLPGTIQAENYDTGGSAVAYGDSTTGNYGGAYRNEDVDIESTTDTGGGYDVGWIAQGEWLKYTVNVTSAGTYNIAARVACAGTGGTFHIEVNGIDKTGPMTISDTGGWQSWITITKSNVTLSAGTQVWRVVFDTAGPSGVIGNLNSLTLTTASGGGPLTPYGGTAVSLPGTIQAENFDDGTSGVAYLDSTQGNSGGQYRATNVDIETSSEGGYDVGWIATGEWLNYTVNVTTAGAYDLEFRVASAGNGGTFHLEVNGSNVTGAMTVPNTGGWQTWTSIKKTGVNLGAGTQVWRVVFDSQGASGGTGNLNYIKVTASGGNGSSTPFGGTPAALAGTLQFENFDDGGSGVAYSDTSAGNFGGQYRGTDVDIEPTSDTGGGYNIGWVSAGEWLKYTVSVSTAGVYDLDVRVASAGTGGTFHIEVNGVDKTGPISVQTTGGWQNWQTIRVSGVSGVTLAAGIQVWRVVMDTNGPTTAVGNFNWLKATLR